MVQDNVLRRYQHCRRRLIERYKFTISFDEYRHMIAYLRCRASIVVPGTQMNLIEFTWCGTSILGAWDGHALITVLPVGSYKNMAIEVIEHGK